MQKCGRISVKFINLESIRKLVQVAIGLSPTNEKSSDSNNNNMWKCKCLRGVCCKRKSGTRNIYSCKTEWLTDWNRKIQKRRAKSNEKCWKMFNIHWTICVHILSRLDVMLYICSGNFLSVCWREMAFHWRLNTRFHPIQFFFFTQLH